MGKSNTPKTEKHIVTEEDLANNPELAAQGVKVGEEIEIPVPSKKASTKTYFYWLKVDNYVSGAEDPTTHKVIEPYEIWPAGLYQTDHIIPRLENAPISNVEMFEDEIPDVVLVEIAKRYHVPTETIEGGKRKIRPAEEILASLAVKK